MLIILVVAVFWIVLVPYVVAGAVMQTEQLWKNRKSRRSEKWTQAITPVIISLVVASIAWPWFFPSRKSTYIKRLIKSRQTEVDYKAQRLHFEQSFDRASA